MYSYTATQGKYANVIFNGNGGQTADLTWTADKYYIHNYNGNSGWYTQAEAETILATPLEYESVYFINTNNWNAVNIYTWGPEVGTWPGVAMTKEDETIAGKDVYSYTVVKGTKFDGIKFDEGQDKAETGDLTWQAGKYYAPSKSKWYDTKEAANEDLTPSFTLTVTANDNAMGSVEGAGTYKQGTTATLTATPAAGYEFVNWTSGEDVVSTDNPYTFTVSADVALVANFKKSVVTHDFYAEGVTVSEGGWSINLSGSWNEQSFTVMLWQDNTQGFGTYAANAETGYSAQLGVKELTPTAPGYYTDMQDGTFTFQGTMSDGTDIYEVYLKGALASSTGTGEMEAKDDVAFSCDADGAWTIEAYADDFTWGLNLEVAQDPETMEWIATGYYVTDTEAGIMEEVQGTGMLYFDDFSGRQVFKGTLATTSGEIYPTLYASRLELMTNNIMTADSDFGEGYYEVYMFETNDAWTLDLHVGNYTGAGTYAVDVVDEEEGIYSTFSGTLVTGELTISEDNSYEASVTTVDNEGNPAMLISVFAWASAAAEYEVVITNATVTENTAGYNIDMVGEWEGHDIKVEVCDELTAETILANFFIDGGIANDGDQAEGTVEATVSEGVVTITGTFECLGSGNVYNVTISGKLPDGTTTALDNFNTTVAPVKVIENGQLIVIKNGVKYNAQGAILK